MSQAHYGEICYCYGYSIWMGNAMKSFFAACLVAIVLAVIGGYALESAQQTAENAFNETGVRL